MINSAVVDRQRTCHQRESSHGRERIVAGRVEDVEAVRLAADAVELAVEVLDRRRVRVAELVAEEARHQRRLADARRPQQHQPETVCTSPNGTKAPIRVASTGTSERTQNRK